MSLMLIINPGSTSKKFGLFKDSEQLAEAYFETLSDSHKITITNGAQKTENSISEDEFSKAHNYFVAWAIRNKLISSESEIQSVGIRIVSPGSFFLEHHEITTDVLEKIKTHQELAPLHLTPAINEIESIFHSGSKARIFAISDSAFHKTIPETNYLYGIDYKDSQNYDIRRFGYHGISVSSVIKKLEEKVGYMPENVIVAHLGGGCSITAVRNGLSFDTSMGYTPLEGLLMSTRPGDMDSGALLQLIREKELDYDEIEHYLNKESGLLGVSEKTGDMKVLLDSLETGDSQSQRAIELFVHKIRKYIGSYIVELGGIDYLVFTATIGERSEPIRRMVCQKLDVSLGLLFDADKNKSPHDHNGYISPMGTDKHILVIPTNEMAQIAQQVSMFFQ